MVSGTRSGSARSDASSPKIGRTACPRARPTSSASRAARSMTSRMPGTAIASSIGSPRLAVVTSTPALLTSFIHFADAMSSNRSTRPECPRSVATASPAGAASTANHDRSGGVCRCTEPGSVMVADTSMTVPTARSAPTTSATASVVMPFCTAATTPVLGEHGRDELRRPARVIGLHHEEHDVERPAERRHLAEVDHPGAHLEVAVGQVDDEAVVRASPRRAPATAR